MQNNFSHVIHGVNVEVSNNKDKLKIFMQEYYCQNVLILLTIVSNLRTLEYRYYHTVCGHNFGI